MDWLRILDVVSKYPNACRDLTRYRVNQLAKRISVIYQEQRILLKQMACEVRLSEDNTRFFFNPDLIKGIRECDQEIAACIHEAQFLANKAGWRCAGHFDDDGSYVFHLYDWEE